MWILGHLTLAEGRLHQFIFGEPNPVAHLKPLFDWGTEPKSDPGIYPSFEGLLQTYRSLRAKTLTLVDAMNDDDFDQPTKSPPPGLETWFATIGQTLLIIASHQSYHGGQASVVKHTVGKPAAFVPSQELRDF